MTALTITPGLVIAATGAIRETGTAGETITAGMAVYRDGATNKYMKADSNSATAAARQVRGIALCGASLNQPMFICKSGDITMGATMVAGEAYHLSDTPGAIVELADLVEGDYICQLGLAKSTTVLHLDIQFPNVVTPALPTAT